MITIAIGFACVLGSLYLAVTSYANPVLPLTIAAIGGACLVTGAFLVGDKPSKQLVLLAVISALLGAWVISLYAPTAVIVFGNEYPVPLYYETMDMTQGDVPPGELIASSGGFIWPETGTEYADVGTTDAIRDGTDEWVTNTIMPEPDDFYYYYPYPNRYGDVTLPFWPFVSAVLTVLIAWLGVRSWPRD